MQLALDFEGLNDGVKDKTAPANPDAVDIGDAAGATTGANAMDADAANPVVAQPNGMDTDAVAQPNGMDTDAVTQPMPAEESKEPSAAPKEAPKPAAKDAKDAKKDKKAATAKAPPAYTPILDENLSMVGVCNKAHKKTQNIIQVLYVKNAVNAMV